MNEPTLKLPPAADELLKNFPLVEPDFEAQAQAIEARVKGDAKVSDPGALLPPSAGIASEDLLKAPTLAAELGEPGAPASSVRAAEPPKSNFAEMARKSVQKKGDDSTEIARELMAATAQSRRPSAEMVERVRAAGRTSATTSPLPSSEAGADEAQRTSGVIARPVASAQPAPINRGTLMGIAGGVLALAACVALFVKSGNSEQAPSTAAAVAAEKASQPTPAAPQALPAVATEAKSSEGVMSPDALAQAPAAEARDEARGGAAKSAPAAAGPAAAPGKGAPTPSAGAKPMAVVLEDDPEPAKQATAEPKPEAAPEPVLKPAEGSSGGVPLTPSAGAIGAALNSVRGSAQACLAGQSAPVSVAVTFAADGHVLRVGAAGPAAACIQAALSKARIQPFAKESFTANTTIRPP